MVPKKGTNSRAKKVSRDAAVILRRLASLQAALMRLVSAAAAIAATGSTGVAQKGQACARLLMVSPQWGQENLDACAIRQVGHSETSVLE